MKTKLFYILFTFLTIAIKAQSEFITIWKPINSQPNIQAPYQSNSSSIWFPGIGNNFNVYWEEIGNPSHNGTMNNITSTGQFYIDFTDPFKPEPSGANYRVKINNGNGQFHNIKFIGSQFFQGDYNKIIEVENWGNIVWTNMDNAFAYCQNLDVVATDVPNLTQVQSMKFMFSDCHKLVGNSSFNNWNVSHVNNMEAVFASCKLFNQPLNNWNLSNVTTITDMFIFTDVFDQPLNNWNTSNITDMSGTFAEAKKFNQPLNNWNTSNVTNMDGMFANAKKFNQNINNWDVSQVVYLSGMFAGNIDYNQPLDQWNITSAISTNSMFAFNTNFNQPLNTWNTSHITDMKGMFSFATSFNQPLNNWQTAQVTDMRSVFQNATQFNQSLENWNLSSITNLLAQSILSNSGLDCINYSKTLKGWANNIQTPNNLTINATPLVYSSDVQNNRNVLLAKGWIITGDSLGSCFLSTQENISSATKPYIYPNPAVDAIFVYNINDAKSYLIFDMSGRLISKDNIINNTIKITYLQKGTYTLVLKTLDKTNYSFKFIKK